MDVVGSLFGALYPVLNDEEVGVDFGVAVFGVGGDDEVEESGGVAGAEVFDGGDASGAQEAGGFGSDTVELHEFDGVGDVVDLVHRHADGGVERLAVFGGEDAQEKVFGGLDSDGFEFGGDGSGEEVDVFDPTNMTTSNGCTALLLEVDRETGQVQLLDCIQAHDAGVIVNPMLADGQIAGGLAQAFGGGLYEEFVYDEEAQLRTASFMDFLLPTASEIPPFTFLHQETPAPHIPGGMKGLGEGGTIAGVSVVHSDICIKEVSKWPRGYLGGEAWWRCDFAV